MFRAIVFDLDHTLFDRYATIRKTFIAFYNQYRDRIPQELSYEEFVEKVIEVEKVYIYYGWHTVIKELANHGLMTPMTEEEVITAVREVVVDKCWALAAVKLPFTIPTLNKLREMGYKIGLITNG
ncbi:MAG: HAD hydrolase-like protein, partial [Clostridia bacterium]|nr:HAD hydrolase-like protein [Clostridia bacterium]